MARVTTKSEFAGAGCLIQGVALVVAVGGFALGPIVGVIGLVAGIALFIHGSNTSQKTYCSECHNPVAHKKVRLCPTCKAALTP